jgi:beta-glucanase (GH16 family)
MLRRTRALTVVAVTATAALAVSVIQVFADEDQGLTIRPVADATITQVPQDGDTAVKTTLASCPRLCDGNPNGQRDAVLQFAVGKLPANATAVRATLRVYAWHNFPARILARAVDGRAAAAPIDRLASLHSPTTPALTAGTPLETRNSVTKGYNEFDVSKAVQANGTYRFALQQQTHNTRVYWASKENTREHLRPELVLTYRTTDRPVPTPTATVAPPATSPAPTATPTRTTPAPTTKPTTTAPQPTAPQPTAPTTPAPQGWRQVFADEFNDNTIDRKKWNVRGSEGRDIDLGCNTDSPKNSFEQGGHLTIRALRESSRCSSQNRQYTQAYLDTIGKVSFTYGRFEMRAKSPNKPSTSKGLWPAFWLRPDDGGNGEIDVVELPGGADWYAKATQAIFWDYSPVKQDTRTALPGGGYPGDGFHTYTTEWDKNELRWYIDGKQVWKRDRSTTPWFDKAFHKPYNLRLNFQVGGWLGDPDSTTAFPADFVVDYVRVWQR